MRIQMTPKTVRRLLSADGYLDLGMPERAIEELEKIADAGPLEGPTKLMYGIALKQIGNFSNAITQLEKAARLMPNRSIASHGGNSWMLTAPSAV